MVSIHSGNIYRVHEDTTINMQCTCDMTFFSFLSLFFFLFLFLFIAQGTTFFGKDIIKQDMYFTNLQSLNNNTKTFPP